MIEPSRGVKRLAEFSPFADDRDGPFERARNGAMRITSVVNCKEEIGLTPASNSEDNDRANRAMSSLRKSLPKTGICRHNSSIAAFPGAVRDQRRRAMMETTITVGISHQPRSRMKWLKPIKTRAGPGRFCLPSRNEAKIGRMTNAKNPVTAEAIRRTAIG